MKIAFLGNFDPPHSTENECLKALNSLKHEVDPIQENAPNAFKFDPSPYDMVLWVHTQWPEPDHPAEYRMLIKAAQAGIPVIGYHLDRWRGLSREYLVGEEPFFRVAMLFSPDNGAEDMWAKYGVNHSWLPPAISEFECEKGTFQERYETDIAFFGNWQGGYHKESAHRHELVKWLRRQYKNQVRFYPQPGEVTLRGTDLQDAIASAKIVVGDSCYTSPDDGYYWSDRIPEMLGREAFLLHPIVPGMETKFRPGEHFDGWQMGDWGELKVLIDRYLEDDEARNRIAKTAAEHVKAYHTYTNRMRLVTSSAQQVVPCLREEIGD